ncbi:MAG: hypothetical protein L0Y58_22090 [Verrucomicrobia subdivision 3 bacterium]|nr:hypothetical protein [Limisphaerales bacterium]
MSVAEIKEAVELLTPEERLDLAAYLHWRTRRDDPEWQNELARRLDRSIAGHGHSEQVLREVHDRLDREGK